MNRRKAFEQQFDRENGSILERAFDTLWKQGSYDVPDPWGMGGSAQYKPVPGRLFRADRTWPELKIVIELEGGTWAPPWSKTGQAAHTNPREFDEDVRKYNLYAYHGWRLFRLTSTTVKERAQMDLIADAVSKEMQRRGLTAEDLTIERQARLV